MSRIRDYWRIVLLVVLLVGSGIAIFVPGVGLGAAASGPTNLQYGLDLSGGTRVRAPLVGVTAEGVNVTSSNARQLQATVAEAYPNLSRSQVEVRPAGATPGIDGGTIEVYANVSTASLSSTLDSAGIGYARVREGVTAPTRTTAANVIQRKIDASGLSGGTVQVSSTPNGQYYVVVEVPNQNQSQVRQLVSGRGLVEIVAEHPGKNGTSQNETVLTQQDIAGVQPVQPPDNRPGGINAWYVPITLTPDGAQTFATSMQQNGFTSSSGTGHCRQGSGALYPPASRYCINTVLDGRIVYRANMGATLAQSIQNGAFAKDQSFVITASNQSEASRLRLNLQAGALPTTLDLDKGTQSYVAPALAQNFKLYSLFTGIIAVFAVAGVVFFRYGDPKVAAPMVVTALSEVAILLGFAAMVGMALDLSHIAGFVAVIGTGVDDLIIIADEVLGEGDVSSGRVFQNRFRKAFWIIGGAAATTIIAMSPLAFIRDLRGFAIVTILGVLIGVLITRPAYGDILRALLTDR